MGHEDAQDDKGRSHLLSIWIFGFLLLTIVIPMLIIFVVLPSELRAEGLATLAAVPAMEYLAVSVGIGLGIDPLSSFLLTVLPCIGACMLVLGLLGHLGDRSERVKRFQGKVQGRLDKYPKLKRYGVASNFVFIIITGFYIGPGIAWILGWPRHSSLLMMALGIMSITMLIGLGTVGLVSLFFV